MTEHPKADAALAAAVVVGVVAAARHEKRNTGKTHKSLKCTGTFFLLGIVLLWLASLPAMEPSYYGGSHLSGLAKCLVVLAILSWVSSFVCVFWFICHWLSWQGERHAA